MAAKSVQIEVCDQITKVCRVEKKGKKVRISDAFLFKTPEASVQDGVIVNPAVLGEELTNQLAAHGLGNVKNAVFALSSNKIAVREARLPYMKPKFIGNAVLTNAQEYFPVDLQNYNIAYSVLDSVPGPDGFVRVMAYATPTSLLDGYAQLAQECGLLVKGMDASGNSQYQALKGLDLKDGVTIYIDVGSGSSVISFLYGKNLLMQRAFAFGADELVTHYLSASDRAESDYIGALCGTDTTNSAFDAAALLSEQDVADDLSRFVGGVVRTIDFFSTGKWDAAATRIVLMGPLRHIVGLREQLADATGLETSFLDDVPAFTAFSGAAPDAAAYVSCIGSILSPLDIVSYFSQTGKKKKTGANDVSLKPGLVLLAFCVAISGVLAYSSIKKYNDVHKQVTDTRAQIEALAPAQKAYNTYVSYNKSQKALNEVIAQTKTPNAELKAFFTELENKMPSSILLLSADCEEEGISMNVTVSNYQDAAAAIAELREFTSIADIQVSEATQEKDDAGVSRVSFSLTCTYGKNPYLNKENPYESVIAPSPSPNTAAASASASPSAGGDKA